LNSIQSRVLLFVLAGVFLVVILAAAFVHAQVQRLVRAQFDRALLERSPSLQGQALRRPKQAPEQPVFQDVELPDGRPGRSIALRAHARDLRSESLDAPPGARVECCSSWRAAASGWTRCFRS